VGKQGISWLVYGTKGDHLIQAEGKSQVEAWKAMQAYSICKDRLTKVQETLGQYFEKDEVKGEAGTAGGDVVVKGVLRRDHRLMVMKATARFELRAESPQAFGRLRRRR